MTTPSRIGSLSLLLLPTEIIQIIVGYLWPVETIELLMAAPKLAHLMTDGHLAVQDRFGYTILHWAVSRRAEAIIDLIARRCAQCQVASSQDYTSLHLAISGGLNGITKMLVDAGFDLLAKDHDGRTVLHWACCHSGRYSNLADIVKLLLAKGADPLATAEFNETVLHVILEVDWNPNLTVVQMVIDAGVDVNALDMDGFSPLWWSVTNGHEDAFELLLAHGADPHIRTYNGTILHEAVAYERENLVKRAAELGVDMSVRDDETNETALMMATRGGFDSIARILRDAGAGE